MRFEELSSGGKRGCKADDILSVRFREESKTLIQKSRPSKPRVEYLESIPWNRTNRLTIAVKRLFLKPIRECSALSFSYDYGTKVWNSFYQCFSYWLLAGLACPSPRNWTRIQLVLFLRLAFWTWMVGAPTFEGGELKEWQVYWLRTLVVRASNARGKTS